MEEQSKPESPALPPTLPVRQKTKHSSNRWYGARAPQHPPAGSIEMAPASVEPVNAVSDNPAHACVAQKHRTCTTKVGSRHCKTGTC